MIEDSSFNISAINKELTEAFERAKHVLKHISKNVVGNVRFEQQQQKHIYEYYCSVNLLSAELNWFHSKHVTGKIILFLFFASVFAIHFSIIHIHFVSLRLSDRSIQTNQLLIYLLCDIRAVKYSKAIFIS